MIVGLCTSRERVHANIVLIGDPKQLDAVTKSKWSTEMGFKTSLFERLFNLPLYQRDALTGKYNRRYITQLVQNYRSHRFILKIPNELFYENSLQAMASPGELNFMKMKNYSWIRNDFIFDSTELITLELEGLLSKNFPIIFKSVHGTCMRPENETRFVFGGIIFLNVCSFGIILVNFQFTIVTVHVTWLKLMLYWIS